MLEDLTEDLNDMSISELKNEIRFLVAQEFGNYCGKCSKDIRGKMICECGNDLRSQRLQSYEIDLMIRRGAYVIPIGDNKVEIYPRKKRNIQGKPPAYPKVKVMTG
jgi:hypothetical protein